jgi:hypothetical protein
MEMDPNSNVAIETDLLELLKATLISKKAEPKAKRYEVLVLHFL